MKNSSYKKIFISYRVQDTAGETGRLVDDLKRSFADDQIFLDIENLEPGADFVETIEKSLDTCDVVLAVIGPRWVGSREGQSSRINEPNDWVRLEVGTALKRNIRVVPVLVDGGTLPNADQLPPDLQPLLRRQAIEISNKRWRYDTDQLIQFLINSAGIQPMKNQPQVIASAPPAPKKNRTWLYVGITVISTIVVLGIIGSFMEQEQKTGGTNTGTELNTQQKDASPTNTNTAVDQTSSQPNKDTNPEEETTGANVTGTWQEIDEGETATFVLKQSGNYIGVQVQMNGQTISTGTGEISNKNVTLNFPLFGMATVLNATLSNDGNTINGSYTIQANGTTQPVQLKLVSR
jgi:hypothetical protein